MQERQLNQPWFTLLTQVFIACVTFIFFRNIQQRTMVDTSHIFIYQFYGFFAIGLLVVLTVWAIIKRKKISKTVLNGLFLVLNIFLFFFGLDKIQELPYQQRFILKNHTGYPLTELQIFGDTTIEVGTLQPNQKAKAIYNNYIENSSIDMTCYFGQTKDTVNLVAGLTNSIGYLNVVSITVENRKLKVDKSQ
jgi:hypothetical protein